MELYIANYFKFNKNYFQNIDYLFILKFNNLKNIITLTSIFFYLQFKVKF